MNELVLFDSATGEVQQFSSKVTSTALSLPDDLSFDNWVEYGHGLDRMSRAALWWLGDWWAYGNQRYGERVKAVNGLDWEFQTCANAGWVATQIETSRRREVLPWSHHAEVAALDPDEQERFLSRWEKITAEEGKPPTRNNARAEVSAYKRQRDRPTFDPPPADLANCGPFDVLYADPPWRYEHVKTDSRAIENQYPTMPLDEICALEPPVLDDAVLFLWATSPKLAESMQVLDGWGFEYRTCMVWVKDKIGMGYYARQQHELLLIAVRGHIPTPEPSDRPPSVIQAPRTEHSVKPDVFYTLIEAMYPGRRYGEMFARRSRIGWGSWGNQV